MFLKKKKILYSDYKKINKRGGQNKQRGGSEKTLKLIAAGPVYSEHESSEIVQVDKLGINFAKCATMPKNRCKSLHFFNS